MVIGHCSLETSSKNGTYLQSSWLTFLIKAVLLLNAFFSNLYNCKSFNMYLEPFIADYEVWLFLIVEGFKLTYKPTYHKHYILPGRFPKSLNIL